jgi:osmotically inducible protein OsmC
MRQLEKVQYTAKAHTTGGWDGASRSDDGRLDVKLSIPGAPGTNPKQLFAAGWSACFIGAMRHAAGKMKVTLLANLAIDAEVDLCATGGEYFLQARLNVSLPGMDREVAQALADAAHQTCPYLGILLQFLATPDQIGDNLSIMRGTIPSQAAIPLHSHADPEIFYLLEGSLDVFQAIGGHGRWTAVMAGEVVSISGGTNHALHNSSSEPAICLTVPKEGLYAFFRELARPSEAIKQPGPPTQANSRTVAVATKYGYWLATPQENAVIGLSLNEREETR